MKRWRRLALLAGAVLIAAVGLVLSFRGGGRLQFVTAKVTRGDLADTVETTGTLNAVRTVLVGSQVSGSIKQLFVDYNSPVRRGQVIALIDPALFQAALDQAVANLAAARAQLDKDQANLEYTKNAYASDATLMKQDSVSVDALQNAKSAYGQATAQVALDKATVLQAQAAVRVARTNLDYTVIRSPIDGVVVARNVDVGQTVAASFQAPTVFTLATDLGRMQVYAKTDESDAGRIRLGQKASFKVDAFPNEVFWGTVSQRRISATTIQNVVTYDTVIDFDNPDHKLIPGMTAYVTIPVAAVTDALKVPNTALRFVPPPNSADFKAPLLDSAGGEPSPSRGASDPGRRKSTVVWKLQAGRPVPVEIALGLTDHSYTQVTRVLNGELGPQNDLIIAVIGAKAAPAIPR